MVGAGVLALLGSLGFGGEPGEDKSRDGRSAEMQRQAQSLRLFESGKGKRQPVELIPEPILRYSDSARSVRVGSLWAWGGRGRPIAALEVEDYPQRPAETRWLRNLVSLSNGRIEADCPDGSNWSATSPGLEIRPLPDAPAPSEKESVRLIQMRRLAGLFEAHEQAGKTRGDRLQLRLLSRPLHRYSDPAAGLQDGAIFCFAYGTNPEVLLILESRSSPNSPTRWEYGLARMSGGELFVSLDGRQVWNAPEANPPISNATTSSRFVPPIQPSGEPLKADAQSERPRQK